MLDPEARDGNARTNNLMKAVFRELTPPFVWKALQRAIVRAQPREKVELGAERQSDYYDAGYPEIREYRRHYADSQYFFLWCVLIDRIRPA